VYFFAFGGDIPHVTPPEAVEWAISFVQAVDAVSRAPGYPDDLARSLRAQVETL
jgi:hypothetical protein